MQGNIMSFRAFEAQFILILALNEVRCSYW